MLETVDMIQTLKIVQDGKDEVLTGEWRRLGSKTTTSYCQKHALGRAIDTNNPQLRLANLITQIELDARSTRLAQRSGSRRRSGAFPRRLQRLCIA